MYSNQLKTLLPLFMYSSIVFREYLLELNIIFKAFLYWTTFSFNTNLANPPILQICERGAYSPTMNIMWLFIKMHLFKKAWRDEKIQAWKQRICLTVLSFSYSSKRSNSASSSLSKKWWNWVRYSIKFYHCLKYLLIYLSIAIYISISLQIGKI